MTVDMPCVCTDPKSEHAGLAYACWACGCQKYTPDIQAGAAAIKANRVGFGTGAQLPTVEELLPDARERAAARLAAANAEWAESTSARLRRVEQERDEDRDRHRILWNLERDAQVKLRQHLDAVKAELASARAELAQLRGQLAGRGTP